MGAKMQMTNLQMQKELDFLKAATEEIGAMPCRSYPEYSQEEVAAILKREEAKVQANYNAFVKDFHNKNQYNHATTRRDYVLLFSFPGAGKTRLSQYVYEQMQSLNPKNEFNILDKDDYRFLFPHLHFYLKNHIDENGKFEYPATQCIREFLEATLQTASKSVLASGSLGAAVDFPKNAEKAIAKGYHPHVVYLSVNKDICNLSNIYRSAGIFNKIIDNGENLCPRLIPAEYYDKFDRQKYDILHNLSEFQKTKGNQMDISVTNRNFDLLYNSRLTPEADIRQIVRREEQRALTPIELKNMHFQVYTIKQSMQKRIENGIYIPNEKEQKNLLTTLSNLQQHIKDSYSRNNIFLMPYYKGQLVSSM